MGMATFFFFGATIIFLIFQARKEKNGAKPTTSLRLHVTSRTTTSKGKARQGKARYGTRKKREEGGTDGPDQKSIIWQKGMEPNQTIARSDKGKGKRKREIVLNRRGAWLIHGLWDSKCPTTPKDQLRIGGLPSN
jgi:hypothetical protein